VLYSSLKPYHPTLSTVTFGAKKQLEKPVPQIVIAGNGLGGLSAAKELHRCLGSKYLDSNFPGAKVTVIGETSEYVFKPLLLDGFQSGVSASLPMTCVMPRRKKAIIQDSDPQANHHKSVFSFRKAKIKSIDPAQHQVKTSRGTFHYDYLVVALGQVKPDAGKITGLAEKGFFLDSPKDIQQIRDNVDHRLVEALSNGLNVNGLNTNGLNIEAPRQEGPALPATDPGELHLNILSNQKKNLSFYVLGGGPTGVEAALFLNEYVQKRWKELLVSKKPNALSPSIAPKVSILHGGPTLLSGPVFEPIRQAMTSKLTQAGIEIYLNHQVLALEPEGLKVKNIKTGDINYFETVAPISCLGGVPNPVVSAFAPLGERVPVTPFLQVPNVPDVYVIGDLAAAKDSKNNLLPGLGQVAFQQGQYVAQDIVQRLGARSVASSNSATGSTSATAASTLKRKPFVYHHRGISLAAGTQDAVFHVKLPLGLGFNFSGRLASWVRYWFYEYKMHQVEMKS
jgi:NADH dehydrogenase FAD-containing subunit